MRFAAMIPASSAVWTTAPLGVVPARTWASVAGVQVSVPSAVAAREVTVLPDTSTIAARPSSSICVRLTRTARAVAALARQANRAGSGCRAHTAGSDPSRRGTLR